MHAQLEKINGSLIEGILANSQFMPTVTYLGAFLMESQVCFVRSRPAGEVGKQEQKNRNGKNGSPNAQLSARVNPCCPWRLHGVAIDHRQQNAGPRA